MCMQTCESVKEVANFDHGDMFSLQTADHNSHLTIYDTSGRTVTVR